MNLLTPDEHYRLIWNEYDRRMKEMDLIDGQERYPEPRFKREYTVWRPAHFTADRIVELNHKTQLPTNSILHVFDNISHLTETPSLDIPRMEECPFIDRESFRKFVYHVKNFNLAGPITVDDKYIYRVSGLPANLLKFRMQHGSRFRYCNLIDEIPRRRESLTIVNHNPLFRVRLFGRLQTYRKLTLIWSSILNTVYALKHLDKQQFLFVPWGPEVYPKGLFIKNRDILSIATIKRPEDPHYFLMMHLVNFMWEAATTSIFKQLPEEVWPQVNLILNLGEKYLFYNLQTLHDLNQPKNKYYFKFLNQLNMLSLFGRPLESSTKEQVQATIEKHFDESDVPPSESEDSGITKIISPKDTIEEEQDSIVEQAITKISDTVKTQVNPLTHPLGIVPIPMDVSEQIEVESTSISESELKTATQTRTTENLVSNVTKMKADVPAEEVANYAKEFNEELDREAVEFIDKQELLTVAQKKRYMRLATKYKEIKLDGKTLDEIMNAPTDVSLTDNTLSEDLVGELPDKSALSSTVLQFDQAYMKKSFNKHLVEAVTGFRKNGVFLTDMKVEQENDRMNNFMHYTCKYEDINGKTSTVKFRIPQVTKDGRLRIDGTQQVLKKQRINLPIVKISDTEVSLASNYNKTRVQRNITKAHNFYSFIDGFTNSDKSNATIEFGNCAVNIALAYDYAIMAERYRQITFRANGKKWSVWFDYKSRLGHFGDKENKLLALEQEYGTYCGQNGEAWFFINIDNEVRAVNQQGGEIPDWPYERLADILKLSLKEGATAKKQLTEWVNIKMLDKMLPLIFVLGYQYGLRNILDYLGVKYTITESRSRIIVGGSESFNLDTTEDDIEEYEDPTYYEDKELEAEIEEATDSIEEIDDNPNSDDLKDIISKVDDIEPGDFVIGMENFLTELLTLPFSAIKTLFMTMLKVGMKIGKKISKKNQIHVFYKVTMFVDKVSSDTYKIKHVVLTLIAPGGMKFNRFLYSKFNGQTIKREKSLFCGPTAERMASSLSVHVRNIAFASMKQGDLPKPYKNLKELPREVYNEYAKLPTAYDEAYKRIAKHQGHVGLASIDASNEIVNPVGEKRYVPKANDIAIRFADRTLYFNRYPLKHSLIVAGLDDFDCSNYALADFESKDIYYQLLTDRGLSTNYLKGITSFFDLFIDGMTFEVLKKMGEPTNVRDLLIRSAELLSTLDFLPPSSRENHRIRGMEQMVAVIYNELSRSFAGYQSKRGKANVFSVNPDAVFLRIISNASLVASEEINPVQCLKESTYMTYAGVGGRSADSFVLRDRAYAKDDIGIISEATVDNQKVAINAQLSQNAGIADTLGTLTPKDVKDLMPGDVLSNAALLFPFSTHDDTKRVNFISTQCSHWVPTKFTQKPRVRTGYERTLAHMVNRTYAGIAEQNGKVTNVDNESKLVEVIYDDGTKDIFKFGEDFGEISGFAITHDIVAAVKPGQKFKKGDVITYNKGFFTQDKVTGQLDATTGVLANVVMYESDITNEDSTEISTRLSEKLTMYPTNLRVVTLPKNSQVYSYKSVGDHVLNTDDLLVYEEVDIEGGTRILDDDPEALSILSTLNRRTPEAKFNGEIVKIDTYYGCEISEMHESLAKIVRDALRVTNRRNRLAKGTELADEFPEAKKMKEGSKYKGVTFDEDTVCLIYYIKETIPQGRGDKLVVGNQMKCTVAGVFPKPILTESGTEVDLFFSSNSAAKRIVLSPLLHGITSRIIEQIEKDAVALYRGTQSDTNKEKNK